MISASERAVLQVWVWVWVWLPWLGCLVSLSGVCRVSSACMFACRPRGEARSCRELGPAPQCRGIPRSRLRGGGEEKRRTRGASPRDEGQVSACGICLGGQAVMK